MVDLDSISIEAIELRLNSRLKQHFIRASQGSGGRVPSSTWLALIKIILQERPNLTSEINRLFSLLQYSDIQLQGKIAELWLQERDAFGVSMDIFSGKNELRKSILSEWVPVQESVEDVNRENLSAELNAPSRGSLSFIRGLSKLRFREEDALQQDLFNWPGMSSLHEFGATKFTQGERRLDVIYANRNPLEKTLGVDLIYYKEAYGLFVLVQYKIMRKEGSDFIYRPDDQLFEELKRMDDFCNTQPFSGLVQKHEDYRLSDDGFLVKLVPDRGLTPATGDLIKGMYLPREYMNFLISEKGPKGERKGSAITFNTAKRYMTNSQFIENVNSGWIGTRGATSETIRNLIQEYYETGRAVLVAREVTTKKQTN
jgi:hypothetical protein